jgi:hypothetical protein
MKKYYFIESNEKKTGPFTLDQLKDQTIYESDLIWSSEMEDWMQAKKIPEISDIIIIKPPKSPTELVNERIKRDNALIGKAVFKRVFWVFIIVTVITTIIATINTQKFISERLYANSGQRMYYFSDSVFTRSIESAFNNCTVEGGEYDSDELLFFNLLLSSMVFYITIFVPLGWVYYWINRSTVEHYKDWLKS